VWAATGVRRELARGIGELRDQLHELELAHKELAELVDRMTKAEEFEDAIAAAIRSERRAFLNAPRKIAAALIALLVAAPAAHDVIVWLAG
jgi:hypothetical protein